MSTFTSSPKILASSKFNPQNLGQAFSSTYRQFGQGRYSYELACDLLKFRDEQLSKSANSQAKHYANSQSFWAVYESSDDLSESEFQQCLQNELNCLLQHSEVAGNWEPQLCADSDSSTLCFTLDGTTFLVRGLHPHSSNIESRFTHPALVFEICEDFEVHFKEGRYQPISSRKSKSTQIAIDELLGDSTESDSNLLVLSGREKTLDWKTSFAMALGQQSHH